MRWTEDWYGLATLAWYALFILVLVLALCRPS